MSALRALARRIGRHLHGLGSDRRGVAAIEFAFVAPILVLFLLGTTAYFAVTRDRLRVERAAYVVADAVGRQEAYDANFMGLMQTLTQKLCGGLTGPEIRISSITRPETMKVDWSHVTGSYAALKTSDIPVLGYAVVVPVGGSVIIVETRATYTPPFRLFGTAALTHQGVSFARPRRVAEIKKPG